MATYAPLPPLPLTVYRSVWSGGRYIDVRVAAQCEGPLIPARILSIDARAYVITLANQHAACHLGQSGRLSGHHA